jgi:hypothetical protein
LLVVEVTALLYNKYKNKAATTTTTTTTIINKFFIIHGVDDEATR